MGSAKFVKIETYAVCTDVIAAKCESGSEGGKEKRERRRVRRQRSHVDG